MDQILDRIRHWSSLQRLAELDSYLRDDARFSTFKRVEIVEANIAVSPEHAVGSCHLLCKWLEWGVHKDEWRDQFQPIFGRFLRQATLTCCEDLAYCAHPFSSVIAMYVDHCLKYEDKYFLETLKTIAATWRVQNTSDQSPTTFLTSVDVSLMRLCKEFRLYEDAFTILEVPRSGVDRWRPLRLSEVQMFYLFGCEVYAYLRCWGKVDAMTVSAQNLFLNKGGDHDLIGAIKLLNWGIMGDNVVRERKPGKGDFIFQGGHLSPKLRPLLDSLRKQKKSLIADAIRQTEFEPRAKEFLAYLAEEALKASQDRTLATVADVYCRATLTELRSELQILQHKSTTHQSSESVPDLTDEAALQILERLQKKELIKYEHDQNSDMITIETKSRQFSTGSIKQRTDALLVCHTQHVSL